MTEYFLVVLLTEIFLLYSGWKAKKQGDGAVLSFWQKGGFPVLAIMGLFLILIELGWFALPWWGELIEIQITFFFVCFSVLYVRMLNQKIPILKDTPRYIIMIGLIALLFISLIQQVRHFPPITIHEKNVPCSINSLVIYMET